MPHLRCWRTIFFEPSPYGLGLVYGALPALEFRGKAEPGCELHACARIRDFHSEDVLPRIPPSRRSARDAQARCEPQKARLSRSDRSDKDKPKSLLRLKVALLGRFSKRRDWGDRGEPQEHRQECLCYRKNPRTRVRGAGYLGEEWAATESMARRE